MAHETATGQPSRRRIRKRVRRRRPHIWFLLPAALLYGAFFLAPTGGSLWLAFYDWTGLGPIGEFKGLHNFRLVLEDEVFWRSALHNLWMFLALFVFTNTVSLAVAVLLDRKSRIRGVYRAIIFLRTCSRRS
jgi:ABC-type sugar transport system permease subunit